MVSENHSNHQLNSKKLPKVNAGCKCPANGEPSLTWFDLDAVHSHLSSGVASATLIDSEILRGHFQDGQQAGCLCESLVFEFHLLEKLVVLRKEDTVMQPPDAVRFQRSRGVDTTSQLKILLQGEGRTRLT